MKIKINRDLFFNAVSRVQGIIEKRSNMPILSTILLSVEDSSLMIYATDLEISYRQKLEADIIELGSITVSGRKLFEILKESKTDEIYIEERENNRVFITDGITKYTLSFLSPDEYPVFGDTDDYKYVEIPGDIIREMIKKTIYSVSMEETGYRLSGIYIQKVIKDQNTFLRMVATDGHRLSLIDKKLEGINDIEIDTGIMIPKKAINEINKLASGDGSILFAVKGNNCVIKKEDIMINIRLLDTKFPDYNSVIPKEVKHSIKIDRGSLLDGMKKMSIISTETYKGVKLIFQNNTVELKSENPELGEAQEVINISYDGEYIELGFNPRYFIDVLQSMDSEEIIIEFIDNSNPCKITGEKDEGFLGLIMPMRLS